MSDLTGKTIVITGASRGIGEAAAEAFAAAGAAVVLAARSAERLETLAERLRAAGGEAYAQATNVASPEEMARLVDFAVEKTGRLDGLINNAGVIEPIARLGDSDPKAWAEAFDVNLKGVYHGLRFAIPVFQRQGGGTVITVSSGAATSALEGWSHYCAGKAAALMLTRAADLEYRAQGVRVLGLSPGTVATEMQVQIKASGVNPVSQLDPTVHIPPAWAAKAMLWLYGPAGDAYLGEDCRLRADATRDALGLPRDG